MAEIGTRLQRFLFETERQIPEATGELAAPLALVAEAARGAASDGRRRILSISPTANHERTPIYLGSKGDVERLEACVAAAKPR